MTREQWLTPDFDEEPEFGYVENEKKENTAGEQLNELDWLQICDEVNTVEHAALWLSEMTGGEKMWEISHEKKLNIAVIS